MATINKIPKCPPLRFPDFNDEWRVTTLGEIGDIRMCKRIFADQTNTESGVPFYKIGTIGKTADCYISSSLFEEYTKRYPYPTKGQILITCAGTIGRCLIFDGVPSYFQDSNIVWIDNNQSVIANSFLFHILNNTNWSRLNTSTITRLYNDDLRNVLLTFPTLTEQKKIADFLSLIDERIQSCSETIKELKTQKAALRTLVLNTLITKWIKLKQAVEQGTISLKRGEIIPKQSWSSENIYPVYSSSSQNKGLMGFHKSYMFDKELISWSIDGGGYLFYRPKHRFNVTNVCGVLETNDFDYMFLCEALKEQHSKLSFDYQNKAHPSVIQELYDIPVLEITKQQYYGKFFLLLDERIEVEEQLLKKYEEQKKYLLRNMFV